MDGRKTTGALRHSEPHPQIGRKFSRASRSPSGFGSQNPTLNDGKPSPKGSSHVSHQARDSRPTRSLSPVLVSTILDDLQGSTDGEPAANVNLERTQHVSNSAPKEPFGPDQSKPGKEAHLQELNIAVLGSARTGKSTFIRSALDLKVDAGSLISTKKVSLEGRISIVRLVEMDMNLIRDQGGTLAWPAIIDETPLSEIEGVLLLFDVTDSRTFEAVDEAFDLMYQASIPLILVGTKCDTAQKTWQVTTRTVDILLSKYEKVESFQTALRSPETHKRCISVMLRNIMLRRHDTALSLSIVRRPRAATGLLSKQTHYAQSGTKRAFKHSRAVSEISSIGFGQSTRAQFSPADDLESNNANGQRATWDNQCSIKPVDADTTCVNDYKYANEKGFVSATEDRVAGTWGGELEHVKFDSQHTQSFVNDQRVVEINLGGLVDRLLKRPISKYDSNFLTIFLCFYPKFAHPTQLMREIVQRFEAIADNRLPDLLIIATRLRYLGVLHRWIVDYPCDFFQTQTRALVSKFLSGLSLDPLYATAHWEISNLLVSIREDDNVISYTGYRRSRASTMESLISSSSAQSTISTVTADSSTEESTGSGIPAKNNVARHSSTPSSDSTFEPLSTQSSNSGKSCNDFPEDARQQTSSLRPFAQQNLDKTRWHQLMTLSEDQVALEMTRIDWMFYFVIRPRDLIKHISLGAGHKDPTLGLERVSAIVDQFNHVASWVANLILLRDKPKHRALMLEKFLAIAWKLRYLNNYNSLGAVIAGINGTAVHRLSQTRALVSAEARKQFMRLEILMGTSKSHSAYRLGWQNTSGPRIPFLPLHLRDLVSAEAGNKTVLQASEGERINWKKFEVMGEVILGIQESQSLPYPHIKKNGEVYNLIMECKFSKDEDELFDRSVQLEAQDTADPSRRKFGIFQR